MTTDAITRAMALFLDAPLAPHLWEQALAAFAEACGGAAGQLVVLDGRGEINLHWLTNIDPAGRADVEAFGLANPKVNPRLRIGVGAPLMKAIADQDHVDADARRRHPIYAEMFDPLDVAFNCQAVVVRQPDCLMRTSISRSLRQGPLDADAFRAFNLLTPHVRAAARTQMALESARTDGMVTSLGAMAAPAFVLDDAGQVIASTEAAEAMAAEGELLLLRGRALVCAVDVDRPAMDAAIGQALAIAAGALDVPPEPVAVRRSSGVGGMVFEVRPISRPGPPIGRGASVLVVGRSPARPGSAEALRTLYSLTVSESWVALGVADGLSLPELAEARGVAITTIRTQLQAVYGKLGVSRQAELVALVRALG